MDYLFYIFLVALFVIVGVRYFFFNKKEVIKRKLKKAEHKRIIDFKDGDVAKLVGNVQFVDDPLISPLSHRKCAFYYVHVEREYSDDDSSHWKTIIEEEVSNKFLIKDGDKFAFINDSNLKCYIVQDRSFSSGVFNDATPNLKEYLNFKGYKDQGLFGFNKSLRYKEGILENEEKIAVFGKGIWKEASTLGLPKEYGEVLEMTSHEQVAVYLSDDPDTTLLNAQKENLIGNEREEQYNNHYRK